MFEHWMFLALFMVSVIVLPAISGTTLVVGWWNAPKQNKTGYCSFVIAVILMVVSLVINLVLASLVVTYKSGTAIEVIEWGNVILGLLLTIFPIAVSVVIVLGIFKALKKI